MLLSGHGGDPLSFEAMHENSEPRFGRRTSRPIGLAEWRLAAGTTVPAAGAGIVGVGAIHTLGNGFIWDAAADEADDLRWDWSTPGDLVRLDADGTRDLVLRVLCRKFDTTGSASENADLAINATLAWYYPGDANWNVLSTPATAALPAKTTTLASFVWQDLDLGARLVAEGKSIREGSSLQVVLGVNEAVGTALQVHVIGTELRFRRHSALRSRAER